MAGLRSTALAAPAQRWAADAATVFTHIAEDADLPDAAFPGTFAQDGDGFLWIGTENGLARWDGYHFRIYKPDPGDENSVPDSTIEALHVDVRGRLWIGTNSGGLARYDPDRDGFVRAAGGPRGVAGGAVFAIADDGRGGIWFGSVHGLYELDAAGDLIAPSDQRRSRDHGVLGGAVTTLLRDRGGNLWIGTPVGLVRRPRGSAALFPVTLPTTRSVAPDIIAFFEDATGRVWVGTRNAGAFVVGPDVRIVHPIREARRLSTLDSVSVPAIVAGSPGEIWLGTSDSGILVVDSRTLATHWIAHDPAQPSSLPSDTVLSLFRDRTGLVWVATTRSISYCDVGQTAIATIFGGGHHSGGLMGQNVRALLPDGDRIWAGLGRGGVDFVDPLGRHGYHLRLSGPDGGNGVRSFARAPDGTIYLGTISGIFKMSPGHLGTVSPVRIPHMNAGLPVRRLFFALDRLWIVTIDGRLWWLDANGRPRSSLGQIVLPLTDPRITAIAPGPGTSVWIGTNGGLNRFDLRRGVVERIRSEVGDPHGLSSDVISSLVTDQSGRLWVGTEGGGINVLVGRDHAGRALFTRLGIAQGLLNDSIDTVLVDHRGRIWASTDNGLVEVDPTTLAIRTLGQADGVAIAGYWIFSGAVTNHGREAIFGGLGGMTVVQTDLLGPAVANAPLVITEMTVGGKVVRAPRFFENAGSAAPLEVAPGGNSFSVGFAALDYTHSAGMRYSYRLDGYDTDWTEVDAAHRFAAYTNLPPGRYRLDVRGSNRQGAWNARPLALAVRVLPAWYQTLVFRLCAVLVLCGAVMAFVRGRTAYLQRRQRELEREVATRTAELFATQKQLEQIAYFDTLTALPNRRMFTEDFRKLLAVASRQEGRFALMLLDLDGFKHVNDSLGHDAGDAVLVEAAARLRASVRASDCVARLGGDEFAILLGADCEYVQVEAICERIVESFRAEVRLPHTSVGTKTSIGVALFPQDGTTQEALYKSADLALYDAKRSGRNTWRWYRAELRV